MSYGQSRKSNERWEWLVGEVVDLPAELPAEWRAALFLSARSILIQIYGYPHFPRTGSKYDRMAYFEPSIGTVSLHRHGQTAESIRQLRTTLPVTLHLALRQMIRYHTLQSPCSQPSYHARPQLEAWETSAGFFTVDRAAKSWTWSLCIYVTLCIVFFEAGNAS